MLIRTEIEQETEKDYTLCLSITDTGIGISPSDKSTLFSAFNQGDATITRRYGGSGLGLVICKKLAEHMHGRIVLTSELHKGSTFSVYMKVSKLAAYEVEKNQTQRLANVNVICFDDNPLYLEGLCNGLGYWGINSIRVQTLSQLEGAFSANPHCDLAFININPGCEPLIVGILNKHTIPWVLVSKGIIPNYQELGAQAFVFKPPNIQKLHDTVELVLNRPSLMKQSNPELETLRKQLRKINPNILIAEDNPVNRMLLVSLLGENAQIDTVEDGEQAVLICNRKRFDVILLDLQMPNLNGLEADRMIRKISALHKHSPIILISAESTNVNNDSLQKLDVDLCLQKPVDEPLLLGHLLHHIQKMQKNAINWPMCVQKIYGNQALALEFLERFVEELHKNRDEFLTLMQKMDHKGIENAAHKLHGVCCFCGVPQLQSDVAALEASAKHSRNTDELQSALTQVIHSIDAVIQEFEKTYPEIS